MTILLDHFIHVVKTYSKYTKYNLKSILIVQEWKPVLQKAIEIQYDQEIYFLTTHNKFQASKVGILNILSVRIYENHRRERTVSEP